MNPERNNGIKDRFKREPDPIVLAVQLLDLIKNTTNGSSIKTQLAERVEQLLKAEEKRRQNPQVEPENGNGRLPKTQRRELKWYARSKP